MNTPRDDNQYDQPVAYDANGRPLYAHPPVEASSKAANDPAHTVVHIARPLQPDAVEISPELKERHERSQRQYPQLDLSGHEYVVLQVKRHPIGLVVPMIMAFIMICVVLTGIILLPDIIQKTGIIVHDIGALYLIGIILLFLVVASTYIVYWVYVNNTFFLTNESIIERTQLTLFSRNVKSVSLSDVVDVSHRQTGIIEQIFRVGTVQIGTKDSDSDYVFRMVRDPKRQASILIDAVECFKNGRPVGQDVIDDNN